MNFFNRKFSWYLKSYTLKFDKSIVFKVKVPVNSCILINLKFNPKIQITWNELRLKKKMFWRTFYAKNNLMDGMQNFWINHAEELPWFLNYDKLRKLE